MASLGATLGKQVGPLPLGAWIAVVGGGLGIAWYAQRSQGAADKGQPPDQQLTETGVGEGTTAFVPAAEVSQPGPPSETLDDWINKAIKQAAAIGATPIQIEQALRTYAKGEKLTTAQERIVNAVITLIGPAPAGEITEIPITTPPPGPTPTHKYTFVWTQVPTRYRNGRAVVFKGKLMDGAKGVGGAVVRVERKHRAGDSWRFYKLVPTFSTGVFAVSVSEPVARASRYYVRFTYKNISRVFTLNQST